MKTETKWTKEEIRIKLETNNTWLCRGLVAIYERQTADEQSGSATIHDNGVGFSGCDSSFLSNLAISYKKYGRLSDKQLVSARKAMLKYAGQLARIANGQP